MVSIPVGADTDLLEDTERREVVHIGFEQEGIGLTAD